MGTSTITKQIQQLNQGTKYKTLVLSSMFFFHHEEIMQPALAAENLQGMPSEQQLVSYEGI